MANSASKSIDYVVPQKKEGKFLVGQILLYILYVVAFVALFVLAGKLFSALGYVIGGVLGILFVYILYLATRHICTFDKKCEIATPTAKKMDEVPHATIFFENVKDKKQDPDKRKFVFKCEIRNAELFAPYTDEYKSKYTASDIKKTIDFRSSKKAKDVYFGIFNTENGKVVVIFETVNKFVEALEYYNKEATVVAQLSK